MYSFRYFRPQAAKVLFEKLKRVWASTNFVNLLLRLVKKKPVFKEGGNACHKLNFKNKGILVQSIK